MGAFGDDLTRRELLDQLSGQLGLPADRIEASAAWRDHAWPTDSLAVAELAMQLEMELSDA